MTKTEVIKRLCALVSEVGSEVYGDALIHDCFCEDQRFNSCDVDEDVVTFVEKAVHDAISKARSSAAWTDKTAEQILADMNEVLNTCTMAFEPEDALSAAALTILYDGNVVITSIVPPEQGWPAMYYCNKCARSVILLNPWAVKPSDGDYWRVTVCADVPAHNLVK